MKYFYAITLIILCSSAFGQVSRAFITKVGKYSNDPKNAVSYILIRKLDGDSAYAVTQYDMHDTIMSSGLYKDELLTIPNGKFVYYHKERLSKDFKKSSPTLAIDTNNYVANAGYYLNGKREGVWHVYDKDGKVIVTDTYLAGKVINTVRSNPDSARFLGSGVIVPTANPKKGVNETLLTGAFAFSGKNIGVVQDAAPEKDFKSLLEKKISTMSENLPNGKLLIQFIVHENGTVDNPSIFKGTGSGQDIDIVNLVPGICAWKPALKDNKPGIQEIYCIINIQNSHIAVTYSANLNDIINN
jgi:hypothetical protein